MAKKLKASNQVQIRYEVVQGRVRDVAVLKLQQGVPQKVGDPPLHIRWDTPWGAAHLDVFTTK